MIMRLRDGPTAPGTLERDAMNLLQSAEAYRPPAGAKGRVRAALMRQASHRSVRVLRPAAVVAVTVLAAGAATASVSSVGRRWVVAGYERVAALVTPHRRAPARVSAVVDRADLPGTPEPVRPRPARPAQIDTPAAVDVAIAAPTGAARKVRVGIGHSGRLARSNRRIWREPAPVAREVVAPVEVDVAAAPAPAEPAAIPAAAVAAGSTTAAPAPRELRDPTPADDSALVVEAMRSLRRDGDGARAGRLLAEYLRRWPQGELAEEALALSFEAATVRGDDRRARDLATRYLLRFPGGRFGEAARRMLRPGS